MSDWLQLLAVVRGHSPNWNFGYWQCSPTNKSRTFVTVSYQQIQDFCHRLLPTNPGLLSPSPTNKSTTSVTVSYQQIQDFCHRLLPTNPGLLSPSPTNKSRTSVTVFNWNGEKEEQTLRGQLEGEIPGHSDKWWKTRQNVYHIPDYSTKTLGFTCTTEGSGRHHAKCDTTEANSLTFWPLMSTIVVVPHR